MAKSKSSRATSQDDEAHYTSEDALVLIMGPSGVGKSTFINHYSGTNVAKVTHDYATCTRNIEPFPSVIPNDFLPSAKKRLVLIDTPGFFGGDVADLDTLQQITNWLRPKHGPERHLTGIIYLHDMTQKRIVRETQMSLSLFQKICGADSCSKTVLVKTQWPKPIDQQSIDRSEDLEATFFKEMKDHGAKCLDLKDGVTEKRVIQYILDNDAAKDIILQLQKELQEGKTIPFTGAGQELRRCLMELLMYTDPGSQRQQIAAIRKTIKQLNTHPTLGQRIRSWFRL